MSLVGSLDAGVTNTVVSVPTGYRDAVQMIVGAVGVVYCTNIQTGLGFGVADVCVRWQDVREEESVKTFKRFFADGMEPDKEKQCKVVCLR